MSDMEQYMREVSVMLSSVLGGGSEWFKKVGDEYYVCPKLAGEELQRRKTDAIITKKALFRSSQPDPQVTALVEALRRCDQIVATYNNRQNEKVEDVRYIVRNALNAWEQSNG